MLDFEEEIKKFEPAIEVEMAEEAIRRRDLTDMTDILVKMTAAQSAAQGNGQIGM